MVYNDTAYVIGGIFIKEKKEIRLIVSKYIDEVLTSYSIKSGYTKTHIVRTAIIKYLKFKGVLKNESY